MNARTAAAALAVALGAGCGAAEDDAAFADVTARSGLAQVRHYAGFTRDRYLPETMGGGVGLLDYDLDGALDLYLVQSAPRAGAAAPETPPVNQLFRNRGDATFEERTDSAGVGDPSFGMGCAIADIEGDGDPDLYVTNYGPNVLYRNAGDGTFIDHSSAAGVADPRWSVSAGFFDADRDGDLDLYVVDYLVFSEELQREVFSRVRTPLGAAYPHPDRFDAAPDRFYRNDGSGVFTEATAEAGFAVALPAKGLGLGFADVEGDGDPDVYVANDSNPNFLFLNDGTGVFEEVAGEVGCAYNLDGNSEASMGVAFGDADGDELPELFLTHLDLETNTYYDNVSRPDFLEFRDRTRPAGLAPSSFRMTGFGTAFLDFDADGHLDLFIANGDLHPNAAELRAGHTYAQPDRLLRGLGNGRFEEASERGGAYFQRALVSRGAALGDLDGDGDPDLAIASSGGPLAILESRATQRGHWLSIALDGARSEPPQGLGARVIVTAGGRRRSAELWTCYSYASAGEAALFFGLGEVSEVERVAVEWPSGAREGWADLAADRRHVLRRGTGVPAADPGSGD